MIPKFFFRHASNGILLVLARINEDICCPIFYNPGKILANQSQCIWFARISEVFSVGVKYSHESWLIPGKTIKNKKHKKWDNISAVFFFRGFAMIN